MIYEITKLPHPILHSPTKKVTVFDDQLKQLILDMRETMHQANGIGLAAPQIGKPLKLAVIEYDPKRFNENGEQDVTIPFFAIINPKIIWHSTDASEYEEGCLSIPGETMPVIRADEIKVLAQNENGDRIRIRAKGLLAEILQHEIDHLNETTIADRTTNRKIRKRLLQAQ